MQSLTVKSMDMQIFQKIIKLDSLMQHFITYLKSMQSRKIKPRILKTTGKSYLKRNMAFPINFIALCIEVILDLCKFCSGLLKLTWISHVIQRKTYERFVTGHDIFYLPSNRDQLAF